ncbi:MAG: class I SAM-dependent methyltransferase [Kiritimatiellaeota bacterium]|nr:class I SAM-dependent methyltransferase [Kiritimatiellota bacterium]
MKEWIIRILNRHFEHFVEYVQRRLVHYRGAVSKHLFPKLLDTLTPRPPADHSDVDPNWQQRLYHVDFDSIPSLRSELKSIEDGYDDLASMRTFWSEQMKSYARTVPFKKGVETILDVGAGNGSFAAACKEAGLMVLSMDFDIYYPNQSVISRRGLLSVNWSARARYPFVDSSFDAIHSHDAFFFFNPAELCSILGELNRVLRPGGYAMITFYQCGGTIQQHEERVNAVEKAAGRLRWHTLRDEKFTQDGTGQRGVSFIFRS